MTRRLSVCLWTHADNVLFASLPRAGKRLAPRLLAEIGDDRSRYADMAGVKALAGTVPVCFASVNYAKAHRRSACLKPLRNAMQQFAWYSTLQEPWALAYYRRKRAEGKRHSVAPAGAGQCLAADHLCDVAPYALPAANVSGSARAAHAHGGLSA